MQQTIQFIPNLVQNINYTRYLFLHAHTEYDASSSKRNQILHSEKFCMLNRESDKSGSIKSEQI